MATLSLPETIEDEMDALVRGGYFRSRDGFIEEAVRHMMLNRGDLKINAAIEMYRSGGVSLGRAAELARLSIFEFEEMLKMRGVKIIVEAPDREELERELRMLKDAR